MIPKLIWGAARLHYRSLDLWVGTGPSTAGAVMFPADDQPEAFFGRRTPSTTGWRPSARIIASANVGIARGLFCDDRSRHHRQAAGRRPAGNPVTAAALDATLVSGILIGLVWAASRFLPPDLAERLRWALLPSVAVAWTTVLLLRLA